MPPISKPATGHDSGPVPSVPVRKTCLHQIHVNVIEQPPSQLCKWTFSWEFIPQYPACILLPHHPALESKHTTCLGLIALINSDSTHISCVPNFSPQNYLTSLWYKLLMFNYPDSMFLPYYCLWLQRKLQTWRQWYADTIHGITVGHSGNLLSSRSWPVAALPSLWLLFLQ